MLERIDGGGIEGTAGTGAWMDGVRGRGGVDGGTNE